MCGITGFIDGDFLLKGPKDILFKMLHALNHRGPDDSGFYFHNNIGIAHCRLSIQDLTTAGHQPMQSVSGRYILSYNGEIYNFKQLQAELKAMGVIFKSNSDTEVLLMSLEQWGLKKTLAKILGMYAFVYLDKKENKLFLIRDRAGEKPLYYGYQDKLFFFSSELKSLKFLSAFKRKISKEAVDEYFKFGYIPDPLSIYKNVFKLSPGHFLELNLEDKNLNLDKLMPHCYGDFVSSFSVQKKTGQICHFNQALKQLDDTLTDIVSQQMIADVPIGVFLSGGIDSTIIAHKLQQLSSDPVKSFSVGFKEKGFDESHAAARFAKKIGMDHRSYIFSSSDLLNLAPTMNEIYDEPFADSSQLPTTLLSKFASKDVKVVLTGDGADEIFGGYNRHFYLPRIYAYKNKLTTLILNVILKEDGPSFLTRGIDLYGKLVGKKELLIKFQKIKKILNSPSLLDAYSCVLSMGGRGTSVSDNLKAIFNNRGFAVEEKMMLFDFHHYLAGDILTKVDRATMAHSLESRIPFLDKRMIEFSWKLPLKFKIKGSRGKYILKKYLQNKGFSEVISRAKSGFSIPLSTWFKKDLKNWSEEMIFENRYLDEFLNFDLIRSQWNSHQEGKFDASSKLWSIVMFSQWLKAQNCNTKEEGAIEKNYTSGKRRFFDNQL